ncbi:MAG: alpha/beta hydrolase [Pseudomonadota bacterium]
MFVITNRTIDDSKSRFKKFGREPNPHGPNELRLLSVSDDNKVTQLNDTLSSGEVEALVKKFNLNIDVKEQHYRSLAVACSLFERARSDKKSILLYVHGYNNDVEDVVETARDIEATYDNTIVVPFTWPANGGGPLSGTAAYLSDKDDARVSATALHRVVQKLHHYHSMLVSGLRQKCLITSHKRHPDNTEKAKMFFDELMCKECQTRISLLCHSMGNYVLKYALRPSGSALRALTFDNIALVAADVNNEGHEYWIADLPTRNRLYVVINEDDGALKWSRRKPGEEQLARLGHYLRNLSSSTTYYIDVTRNRGVGSAHSYFKSEFVNNNKTLKRIFSAMFEGEDAERSLTYHADVNVYRS